MKTSVNKFTLAWNLHKCTKGVVASRVNIKFPKKNHTWEILFELKVFFFRDQKPAKKSDQESLSLSISLLDGVSTTPNKGHHKTYNGREIYCFVLDTSELLLVVLLSIHERIKIQRKKKLPKVCSTVAHYLWSYTRNILNHKIKVFCELLQVFFITGIIHKFHKYLVCES